MPDYTKAQARRIVSLRLSLAGGYADLFRFKEELIAQIKAGDSKAASTAFQNLYRKSGAMEAAVTAAKKLDGGYYAICASGAHVATVYFRHALDVLGGATRESQEVVVGDTVLKDEARKQLTLDTVESIWAALAEELETEGRENPQAKGAPLDGGFRK
jgi:hypothetical protein